MGVEYYLVDEAGKNVLACGKYYELTTNSPLTAAEVPEGWQRQRVIAWLREVAEGRPCRVVTDCGLGDPSEFEDDLCRPLPGWSGWTLYVEAGWTSWMPEDVPDTGPVFGASGWYEV
tara:strand:- start:405 stop:755 length:351 start_codon:yes stop_codon:yes gene_type:complete